MVFFDTPKFDYFDGYIKKLTKLHMFHCKSSKIDYFDSYWMTEYANL